MNEQYTITLRYIRQEQIAEEFVQYLLDGDFDLAKTVLDAMKTWLKDPKEGDFFNALKIKEYEEALDSYL